MGDRFATIDMGLKEGRRLLYPFREELGVARAQAYLYTNWHLDPSSCLAKYMGRRGGCCSTPLLGVELGPHLTQCRLGRGLLPCQVSSSAILATILQRYRQTGQSARQDNGACDSIGRSVLQTVAQKISCKSTLSRTGRNAKYHEIFSA